MFGDCHWTDLLENSKNFETFSRKMRMNEQIDFVLKRIDAIMLCDMV